jgi:hypothetical protein
VSALPARGCGHITPVEQGQTCYRESWPVGADGCLIRHVDRSELPSADTWTLHPWLVDGEYEPQNGRLSCRARGRRVTAEQAARLLAAQED